jgi:hypothetical protein
MKFVAKPSGARSLSIMNWPGIRMLAQSKTLFVLTRDVRGVLHRIQRRRIAHLLHIGKTGGMALSCALAPYANSGRYEIRLYSHNFTLKDVPRGEKLVFFLRDPISRFISAFYYRKRLSAPRFTHPWTRSEEAAFTRFGTANELALALSSDDLELRAAGVDAMLNIEHIRSPQLSWFIEASYLLSRKSDILFIGFQETLNADFEILKRILDLPADVQLTDDEVTANRSPIDIDKRLDEEAIRNLKSWYVKDYQLLAICREIAAEIRSNFERTYAISTQLESAVANGRLTNPADAWSEGGVRCSPQPSASWPGRSDPTA